MYLNQYILKEIFKENDEYFIFKNLIERNFKESFIEDITIDGKKKNNIKHYEVEKIIKSLYYRARRIKSFSKMYSIYKKFIMYYSNYINEFDNTTKFYIQQFPKPKYQRKKWKRWNEIRERLKFLKRLRKKVKKDIENGELHKTSKLNNIEDEIILLKRRKQELAKTIS